MYINRVWLMEVDFIVFSIGNDLFVIVKEMFVNSLVILLIREFVVD